jgi:small-conductance mechanosensitive channel
VPEFSPLVRYHTLGDSSIDFNVILRVRNYTDQSLVKHAFIKKLISRYREDGINVPFPVRTVYMKRAEIRFLLTKASPRKAYHIFIFSHGNEFVAAFNDI